ncbi:MAG: DUF1186 domain-containing protein [Alphaproteobacteria bacterium]|nr:DUF1186 domain-containing protein [Alphaproteobacteria bacterium]
MIESPTAYEFVRSAALDALPYFVRHGAFSDDEVRAYLLHLRDTMRPRGENHVWPTWAIVIANLGYADLADAARDVFRRGFVDPVSMTMDDFERDLQRTLGDPTGMAGIEFDRIRPFDDTIGTFSQWYGFSEQYKIDQAKRAERRETEAAAERLAGPYFDPMRRVRRNDPCPCGSGRKFKKCCLQ